MPVPDLTSRNRQPDVMPLMMRDALDARTCRMSEGEFRFVTFNSVASTFEGLLESARRFRMWE